MIRYFARHATAANLLMLVIVLLGVVAAPQLRRETYPEFEPSSVRVSASYPGADAEIVDELLIQPIEGAVAGLDGISQITSQSSEGSASVTVEVEDGAEIDQVVADIKSAVDGLRDLPASVDPPTVAASTRRAAVASIAISGEMPARDLKLYCEQLRRELLRAPEVSQVSLAGFSTHQLLIRVDPTALARNGLTVADVAAAVEAQSVDLPVGTLARPGGDILVRYSDERTSATELGELVVKAAATGAEVRLTDLAQVLDTFAVEEEQFHFNGHRACTLGVTKSAWQDSLDVLAAIEAFVADQDARKPTGVTLTITENVASTIQDQLDLLLENAVMGLVLVFVTLWLFFHVRLAFWVAMGLPVSVLGAMWVMGLLGQTINMMTMMGMLVALGLVMDDAIVIAENVASHLQRGKSAVRAAIDGTREVAEGVLSSFITTLAVFVPLAGIDGRIGRVLQVIPIVLVAVLAASLIEAFLVLPNHLGHTLRHVDPSKPSRWRAAFDRRFDRFRERGLGGLVDIAVRHRYAAVGLTIAVFLVSVAMVSSGRLKYVAFPAAEGDVAQFRIALPPGTPLERTEQEVARVVDAAWQVSEQLTGEQPDQQPLVRNVSARFNYNADVDESGPHLATVSVDLLSVEFRTVTLDEFSAAWRDQTGPLSGNATARFAQGSGRGPAGNAIEVKIQSEDLARVEEVSQRLQAWFAEFPGVADLGDDLDPGSEQLRVRLRPGAGSTGLTGTVVAQQVAAALGGTSVRDFQADGEDYELFVELERSSRETLADLQLLAITVSPGVTVPLGTIATIDATRGYARINRSDGTRTVTVTGSLDPLVGNAAEIMARFEQELAPEIERDYPEIGLASGGSAAQSAEALGSMGRGLAIGLFAVFALLSLQFRSYVAPVLVMLAVPFSFIGVVWGHLAMGMTLSSQSIFGLIAMAGVVVNDSILLVVFLQEQRAKGASHIEAACFASRDRFRAVLLTSATTIAGLVPIMFETSRNAQTLIPLAASIVFGLAASTVLVLVILPAAYTILGDLGLAPEPTQPDDDADAPAPPTS